MEKRNTIKYWTASQFLARNFDIENDVEFITGGGLLPQNGKAIIGGISKIGKSLLALEWGLCLAKGIDFLIQFSIKKKFKVLLLQAEISEISIFNRLIKMINVLGEDGLDNLYIINEKKIKLDRGRDINLLLPLLEEIHPEVLILDPLYKFHCGDENRPTDMIRFFDQFDFLLDKFGMAGIIVHHFGKPSEVKREGAQQLRGASTIFDWGDSYLLLSRMKDKSSKGYLKITFELRNEEDPAPIYIHRNPETLLSEILDEETEGSLSITKIVKALKELGGRAKQSDLIKKLENETGLSYRWIKDVIQRGIKIGRIREIPSIHVGRGSSPELCLN